jgi:hypothetical protein
MAEMGHRVVAVEPTDELREAGMTLHKSMGIEWVADGLPDLDLMVATERASISLSSGQFGCTSMNHNVAWQCQEWLV